MNPNRSLFGSWWIAVLALLALRLTVGLHFFSEGLDKVRSGSFDASGFLANAQGPFASGFSSLLDDPDHSLLLCIASSPAGTDGSAAQVAVDPALTIALWNDFSDICASHYRFGDPELIARLKRLKAELAKKPADAPPGDNAAKTGERERQLAAVDADLAQLEKQRELAAAIVSEHMGQLNAWLDQNRVALIEHFSTAQRETGFLRDGEAARTIAREVESLREQTATVRSDRRRRALGWATEIQQLWNSLESSLNELAVDTQQSRAPVRLHRPFDQPSSPIKWINRVIPWFDLTVGILLAIGLLPRLAAFAGALFLLSVVLTQPPWLPGTTPVWSQAIEMSALFALSTGLGALVPGLGWWIPGRRQKEPVPMAAQN